MNNLAAAVNTICKMGAVAFVTAWVTTSVVLKWRERARRKRVIGPNEAIDDVQKFRPWIMARSLLPKTVWMCLTESEFEKFREYVLFYWSDPDRPFTETELKTWAHRFVERKRRLCCQ